MGTKQRTHRVARAMHNQGVKLMAKCAHLRALPECQGLQVGQRAELANAIVRHGLAGKVQLV